MTSRYQDEYVAVTALDSAYGNANELAQYSVQQFGPNWKRSIEFMVCEDETRVCNHSFEHERVNWRNMGRLIANRVASETPQFACCQESQACRQGLDVRRGDKKHTIGPEEAAALPKQVPWVLDVLDDL